MNNYSNEIPFNLDLIEVEKYNIKKENKVCIFIFPNMTFFYIWIFIK